MVYIGLVNLHKNPKIQYIMSELASTECQDTKNLMEIVFSIFPKVFNFKDLYSAYHAHLTKARASGGWDPRRIEDSLQQVKVRLTEMDPTKLSVSGEDFRKRILWIWYYYAMEYALLIHNGLTDEERSSLVHECVLDMLNTRWYAEFYKNINQRELAKVWAFIVNNDFSGLRAWKETLAVRADKLEAADIYNIYFLQRDGLVGIIPMMVPV